MFGGSSSPFILTSFAAGSGGGGGGAGFGFQLGGVVVAGTGNTPANGFTLNDGGANTMVFDPSSPSLIVQSANFGSTTRANFFDVSSRTDLTEATLAPASLQLFNAAGVITINADATVPSIALADGTGNTNVADVTDIQLTFPSNNNALVQISSSFITGIQASDTGGTGSCEAAHLSHQLVSGQSTSIIGGVIHSEDDAGNFFITSDATVSSTTWGDGAGAVASITVGAGIGSIAQHFQDVDGDTLDFSMTGGVVQSQGVAFTGEQYILGAGGSQALLVLSAVGGGQEALIQVTGSGGSAQLLADSSGAVLHLTDGGNSSQITANSQSTVGAAGGASALPVLPAGYLLILVNGVSQVIPYYAAS